jgi:hypothetical protein
MQELDGGGDSLEEWIKKWLVRAGQLRRTATNAEGACPTGGMAIEMSRYPRQNRRQASMEVLSSRSTLLYRQRMSTDLQPFAAEQLRSLRKGKCANRTPANGLMGKRRKDELSSRPASRVCINAPCGWTLPGKRTCSSHVRCAAHATPRGYHALD